LLVQGRCRALSNAEWLSLARQNLPQDTGQKPAGRLALPEVGVRRAGRRFGSIADMCSAKEHVRFTPESRHVQRNSACLLCANRHILASQRDVRSYLESGHLLASIEYPLKSEVPITY
ncbi:MAG: hypothetical protein WA375_02975, partial [Pseudolabrys sp.]